MPRIALIGFMTSGKTAVANRLSERYFIPVFDTDVVFQQMFALSAGDWIRQHGELSFRQRELQVLNALFDTMDTNISVIATGGGIVTYEPSRILLQRHCHNVWLRIHPDTVIVRASQDGTDRPLLNQSTDQLQRRQSIEAMLDIRAPLYAEVANDVIDVDGLDVDTIVEHLRRFMDSNERA